MVEHWKDFGVPTYIAASAYLGLTKKGDRGSGKSDEAKYGNLEELEKMFAGTGGVIQ